MGSAVSKAGGDVVPARRDRLSIALWVMQWLFGILFVFSGVVKFLMPADQMMKQSPFPIGFIYFIGVCEILGGIGLILPALLRIRPVLTPVAAIGLAIIMVGATVISIPKGGMAVVPLLFGLASVFIAYGRFNLRPLRARV